MIYVLLVAHFVGDWICQSNWMAAHKSKNWEALTRHVTAYASVLMVALAVASLVRDGWPFAVLDIPSVGVFVAVNGLAHWCQDAVTSRINARLWWFEQLEGWWQEAPRPWKYGGLYVANPFAVRTDLNPHWFWVGIGADQCLHVVTLCITAGWWL